MGMYTAVWMDMTLTERGFEAVSAFYYACVALHAPKDWERNRWAPVGELYPELRDWGAFDNSDSLPLCENDMPLDPQWGGKVNRRAHRDDELGWADYPGRLDAAARRWVFTAQTKNYRGVVEYFLSQVVPLIAVEVNRGWVRYEEMDAPVHWKEWVASHLLSGAPVRR